MTTTEQTKPLLAEDILPSVDALVARKKKARRIATLLAGYLRDELSPREHDELDEWVGANQKNMKLFEELTDGANIEAALNVLNDSSPLYREGYSMGFMQGVMLAIAVWTIIEMIRVL